VDCARCSRCVLVSTSVFLTLEIQSESESNSREVGCYPWDVCAGIVIAEEAGALVTGPHQVFEAIKDTPAFGEVTEDILMGRKYIIVRGIAVNQPLFLD
jgi:hypothetical protein